MTDAIKPIGMPKWGLAMTEGKVNAWLVADGAEITQGEEILEIETSKITNVFESPVTGTLRRKVAEEGDTLPVGALLGVVAEASVGDAEIDAFVEEFKQHEAEMGSEAAPPEPIMVDAGSWSVRVLRMGPDVPHETATPVVLLHGFGGDLLSWQMNQPDIATDRAVYAIDLPGHGGSTKAIAGDGGVAFLAGAVRDALKALDIDRVHLVGHSLGGAVALQLALDEPARVASVTLVCPAGLGTEINGAYLDGFIFNDRRKEMKPVLETLFHEASFVSRDMVEDVLKYKRLDGVIDALRKIAGATFADGKQHTVFADRLEGLGVPVQAVWGESDRIVPASQAFVLPAQRRHVLPAAGHMVHMERPAEVNRLVSEFIAFAGG